MESDYSHKITIYDDIKYFFLMMPFIIPSGISRGGDFKWFVYFSSLMMWFSTIIVVCKYISCIILSDWKRNHLFYSFLFLFSIILILSSSINGISVYYAIRYLRKIIIMIMLTEIIVKEGAIGNTLRYLTFYLTLVALINDISVLFNIHFGVYQTYVEGTTTINYRQWIYFISNDNSFFPYLFPSLIISYLYCELYGKGIIAKGVFTFIFLFSIFYCWSGTAVVLSVTLLFLMVTHIADIIKYSICVMVSIIMQIIFIFLNLSTPVFSFIFENLLKKNITFSGRTYIWRMALAKIIGSPIIGFGKRETDLEFSTLAVSWGTPVSAHSMYLQIIIWCGIVGFIFFILFILSAAYSKGRANKYSKYDTLLKIGIFGVLMYYTMEVHDNVPLFFFILMLFQYSSFFEKDDFYNEYT